MRLTCIHKNHRNKVTVTEYTENYVLKEETGIEEISLSFNNCSRHEKRKRISLNGANIIFSNKTLKEDRIYELNTDFTYLQMRFELAGQTRYIPHPPDEMQYSIGSNNHCLCYFPVLNGTLIQTAGENLASVEIEISLPWLNRVFNNDLSLLGQFSTAIALQRPAVLGGKNSLITKEMQNILMAIHQCHLTGQLKKVFIEGKLLELLALQVKQLTDRKKHESKSALKTTDRERIHYIKNLLLENLHMPHSIHDLAAIACMNRTKWQAEFKNIFSNTIYGFVAEERMKKAHELLFSMEYIKISEIARRIGYKNPNHFSTAFKRKFGYLPKDVKKTSAY